MNIQSAIDRLNSQLPLKARQDQLTPDCKKLHQQVLQTLAQEGRAPSRKELTELAGSDGVDACLKRLASDDLVVMDSTADNPVGAYPITIEKTPHKITLNGHDINAMCALDAVAVAAMFDTEVQIESRCHVSGTTISILMRGSDVVSASPGPGVTIGIRWQMPSGVAAHSMCLQMIFLEDHDTAISWQAGDLENISLFSLPEAVEFGKRFFLPLLS